MVTPGPFDITPVPSEEEAAAIIAAVHVATSTGGGEPEPIVTPRWRFSGRWWSQPVPLRRVRPW